MRSTILLFLFILAPNIQAKQNNLTVVVFPDHDQHYAQSRFYQAGWSLFSEAAENANVKLEIRSEPWLRSIHLLKQERVDAVFGAVYLKEREIFAKYSLPVAMDSFYLYSASPKSIDFTVDDYNQSYVGVAKGSVQEKIANEMNFAGVYTPVIPQEIFTLLDHKRIDFAIFTESQKNVYCAKFKPELVNTNNCLHPIGDSLKRMPIFVIHQYSPNVVNLIQKINKQILLLIESGRAKSIFTTAKYSDLEYLQWLKNVKLGHIN